MNLTSITIRAYTSEPNQLLYIYWIIKCLWLGAVWFLCQQNICYFSRMKSIPKYIFWTIFTWLLKRKTCYLSIVPSHSTTTLIDHFKTYIQQIYSITFRFSCLNDLKIEIENIFTVSFCIENKIFTAFKWIQEHKLCSRQNLIETNNKPFESWIKELNGVVDLFIASASIPIISC